MTVAIYYFAGTGNRLVAAEGLQPGRDARRCPSPVGRLESVESKRPVSAADLVCAEQQE